MRADGYEVVQKRRLRCGGSPVSVTILAGAGLRRGTRRWAAEVRLGRDLLVVDAPGRRELEAVVRRALPYCVESRSLAALRSPSAGRPATGRRARIAHIFS